MNTDLRYKEEWIELCSVFARINDAGWKAKSDYSTCTVTKSDGILETYVRQNSQWRCSWSYDSFTANTNLEVYQRIKQKYQYAISLAMKDNNKFAIDTLSEEERIHELRLKSDNHGAVLRATATSAAYYKSGAKCDLTLMGKIRRLDV
jgi:hypothetical protein